MSFCLSLFTGVIISTIVVAAAWCSVIFNNLLYCIPLVQLIKPLFSHREHLKLMTISRTWSELRGVKLR